MPADPGIRRTAAAAALLLLVLVPGCARGSADPPASAGVRPPVVAGKFYPGDAPGLEKAVRAYLADALPPRGETPIAIVAPHAGYIFSGQIAADAWRQAADHPCDLVVILGTNHTVAGFDGVSIFQGEGYRTPLGVAPVDQQVARALLAADPAFTFRPEAHAREHSEEVQVPFAQVLFPRAKIVTAVVGRADPDLTGRFGRALAAAVRGRRALIVASSDLSHYPPYDEAVAADRRTLKAVASLDPARLKAEVEAQERENHPGLETCACGEAPIMAAMAAARALGARRGIVISHANSGDTVVGNPEQAVGYGSVIFTAGAGGADTRALDPPPGTPPAGGRAPAGTAGDGSLTEADRHYLLGLARQTIEQYLTTGTLPLPRTGTAGLRRKAGAFVTLNERGRLRGCIGHMAEDTPLALTVARMALEAALHDTRFEPVRVGELPDIEVEISVLTPFAPVSGPEAIVVGRDGALIEKGGRRAVFLPQVAPEQGWTRDQMLDNLCLKAGLPGDCWHSGTKFYTFQAVVFGEKPTR